MTDDESTSSESESNEPLIPNNQHAKKEKKSFKDIVKNKIMKNTDIEMNIIELREPELIKKDNEIVINTENTVIDERPKTFLGNRNSSTIRCQGRRDTDILDSAEVRDLEWTKRCLETSSSAEATCRMGKMSVCHVAAFFGEDGILEEVLKVKPCLLKRGDENGRTPLHYAAWEGNLDCLAILLGLKVGDLQRVDMSKENRRRKEKTYQEFHISNQIKSILNSLEGEKVKKYHNLCDSSHSCSSPTKILDIVWSSCTPLHEACARVQLDCVLALLACGADISMKDKDGRTPLDVCGLANKDLEKLEETSGRAFSKIVEAIIHYGKEQKIPKSMWLSNKNGQTSPLHVAVILGSKKATKLLLDIGAIPNVLNEDGQTPLHLAVEFKRSVILRATSNFSGSKESYVESKNSDEYTPLQYAVKHEWIDGVTVLLESNASVINQDNKRKQTALHLAAKIGNLQITDLLLEKVHISDKKGVIDIMNEYGETPLFNAIVNGMPKCVRCFLHEGAAYNITFNGYTVLHKAMQSDNVEVLNTLLEAENVKDLLNITDSENGMTPLHWAAQENKCLYVRILLEKGADPTLKRKTDGATALHIAAIKGRNDVIKELLEYDKETLMNIKDNEGWLPFHKAALHCHRESIEIFLKNGSNLAETVELNSGKKPLIANIIKNNMPRSAEYFENIFNSNMSRNNCSIDQGDCCVNFNYSIMIPHGENKHIQMTAVSALFGYGCNFELSKLILHPYIETFLYLKWTILRRFYLMILGLYGLYVLLLTDMVINFFHDEYHLWVSHIALKIKQTFILIIIAFIFILEIPFMRLKKIKYFYRGEVWVKLGSVLMATLVILIHQTRGISETRLAVAIALLLSWIEITVLLSRFPQFGYYFQMFATVALRVVKVFALFGIFVVFGFSLIFWILIRGNESFISPWDSLIKTVVMMTSEFDYSSLIEGSENDENRIAGEDDATNSVVIQLFFILFLICVPIVFMNLLLALAVSDVKDLEIEGKIQRLQEQVEFLSNLEALAWRINLKVNIVRKLRIDNELIVYPGRPFWDPTNNLPKELLESICINIHERRVEEKRQQYLFDIKNTIDEIAVKIKEQEMRSENNFSDLNGALLKLSNDVKNIKPIVTETRASRMWPSISVLKSGLLKEDK